MTIINNNKYFKKKKKLKSLESLKISYKNSTVLISHPFAFDPFFLLHIKHFKISTT